MPQVDNNRLHNGFKASLVKILTLFGLLAALPLLTACQTFLAGNAPQSGDALPEKAPIQEDLAETPPAPKLGDKTAGRIFQHYLSATLAENRGDIEAAGQHYLRAMRADEDNTYLQDRAFALLLAAGNYMDAVEVAKVITSNQASTQPLVQMLLTFDDAITGKHEKAMVRLSDMRRNAPNLIQFELIEQYIRLAGGEDPETIAQDLKTFDVGAGMIVYKYHHLGRLHLRAGNREAALEALRSGQLVDPNALFIVTALGDVLMAEGRHDEAETLFEAFLNLNPDSLLIHAALKEAMEEKPVTLPEQTIEDDLAEVMFGLASLMIGQEVNITVRQFLHLALMARSEHQMARFMLGLVEEQDGNHQRALVSYKKIKPGSAPHLSAQVRMAEVLFKTGQREQAISHMQELVRDNPDVPRLHQSLARLHQDMQHYKKAARHYTELIKTIDDPRRRHAPLYFARGAAYERLQEFSKAARDLEMSLKLEPNNPVVLNYLGYMWLDQGKNLDSAYDHIRQAAHLRPHDGAIVDSLGWVYYKKGQFETAIRYLEKAVSLLPNDPVINMHLGDAYNKTGRDEEARVKWQRALNLNPENPAHVERLQNLLGE